MIAIAQHWFVELSAGSTAAREQMRTLLAMPVEVSSPNAMLVQSNSSVNFKQYTFIDLERAGLIDLGIFCTPVPYTHISEPITRWQLTELGADVVALLREAGA